MTATEVDDKSNITVSTNYSNKTKPNFWVFITLSNIVYLCLFVRLMYIAILCKIMDFGVLLEMFFNFCFILFLIFLFCVWISQLECLYYRSSFYFYLQLIFVFGRFKSLCWFFFFFSYHDRFNFCGILPVTKRLALFLFCCFCTWLLILKM